MPSREHSFRIGTIEYEEKLPSLRSISGQVELGIRGDIGTRRGIRKIAYDEDSGLLYLIFIKEITTKVTTLDEKNRDTEREIYPRRAMKLVLAPQGTYLYESVQGVSDVEALNYISDQIGQELETDEYREVPRSIMLEFFNEHLHRVKRFKIDEIGKKEPNPGPIRDRLRQIIEEFGEVIDNQENSVGRDPDADAREDDLAYALAETSDPYVIRGEDEDGRIEELNASGIFRARYDDEDMTPEEEADFVIRKVDSVFGNMFNGSHSESNGSLDNGSTDS